MTESKLLGEISCFRASIPIQIFIQFLSLLRSILPSYNLDLESFVHNPDLSSTDDDYQAIYCNLRLTILQDIWEKFSWAHTSFLLFKRLRRLTEFQDFSIRESKLLRRTLKSMKKDFKSYNFQVILDLFPEKFDETIISESKKILNINHNPF